MAAYDFLTGAETFETWLDNEWTGIADITVPGNHPVTDSHREVKEAIQESGRLDKVFMRRPCRSQRRRAWEHFEC